MTSKFMVLFAVIAGSAVAWRPAAHATGCDPSLVDDSTIQINTAADANTMRTKIIKHIWGPNQTVIPTKMPTAIANDITHNAPDPFGSNQTLRDEFNGLMTELGSVVGTVNMIEYRMNQPDGVTRVHTALGWASRP
jgi:hypothetical protein